MRYFIVVLRSVYFDFDGTFGGNSTGWMRLAELDVNNYPPGLRHEISNSVNTCTVIEDNAGCKEIIFPVYIYNTLKSLVRLVKSEYGMCSPYLLFVVTRFWDGWWCIHWQN